MFVFHPPVASAKHICRLLGVIMDDDNVNTPGTPCLSVSARLKWPAAKMAKQPLLLILHVFLALSCLTQCQSEALNALFIGNSYTYYNDLPAIVRELAASDGQTLTTDEHLGPNNRYAKLRFRVLLLKTAMNMT